MTPVTNLASSQLDVLFAPAALRGYGGVGGGWLQSAVGKTVTVRVKAFLFPNRVMQESNHSHGLSLNGSGVEGVGGLSRAVHISQ